MAEIQLTSVKRRDPELDKPPLSAGLGRVAPGPVSDHTYDNTGFSNRSTEGIANSDDIQTPPQANQGDPPPAYMENGGPTTVEEEEPNCCLQKIQTTQTTISAAYQRWKREIKWGFLAILAVLYAVYFAFAMRYRFGDEGSIRLLWVTCLVVAIMLYVVFKNNCGTRFYQYVLKPPVDFIRSRFKIFKWFFIAAVLIGFAVFVGVAIAPRNPYNLISLGGIVTFILLHFIFSHNPAAVRWRPVFWGLGIQFVFGLFIIRTQAGFTAFKWLGDRIKEFLEHTNAGSEFVFGQTFMDHMFAFKVLPTIIFFSTIISVLYYMGVMQVMVQKIGWLMQVTLGTTPGESLNAAGNIFLGQTEAPLLIRPLLPDMTRSELFAVVTGGYASIAGTVMGSFILFGAPPNHLITAAVMAAPGALAIAKLSYPETEETKMKKLKLEKPPHRNVIEAASSGASSAIKLVANIAANIIAFISLLAFVNATLKWLGARVGLEPPNHPPLTFQLICSYLFYPISFLMGVLVQDCRKVGELIGMKIFINEFVAYRQLGTIVNNTNTFYNYTMSNPLSPPTCVNNNEIYLPDRNITLVGGLLQERSKTIATYALCGFANISSLGVAVGALGAMAPSKKSILSQIAVRALIAGNCANFISACIAGLLFTPENPFPSNITIPC